jgi:hypothetical protein
MADIDDPRRAPPPRVPLNDGGMSLGGVITLSVVVAAVLLGLGVGTMYFLLEPQGPIAPPAIAKPAPIPPPAEIAMPAIEAPAPAEKKAGAKAP